MPCWCSMGARSLSSRRTVQVHAPTAQVVRVAVQPAGAAAEVVVDAARDQDGRWVAACDAADGDGYWLLVDDGPPLLDPHCRDVELTADGPRSVFRAPWGPAPQAPALLEPPVVYELHVKGFGGSYLGCIDHLDHVVEVGANVIELLPVLVVP